MEEIDLVLRHDEEVTHLSCRGVMTSQNVPEFNQALIMAVGTSPTTLVIDTTRVSSIGFSGVIALLRAVRWCAESEITLHLDAGPFVTDALDIAGLSWLHESEEVPPLDRQREGALRDQVFDRLVRSPYLT